MCESRDSPLPARPAAGRPADADASSHTYRWPALDGGNPSDLAAAALHVDTGGKRWWRAGWHALLDRPRHAVLTVDPLTLSPLHPPPARK
jgi:hypothetical protein